MHGRDPPPHRGEGLTTEPRPAEATGPHRNRRWRATLGALTALSLAAAALGLLTYGLLTSAPQPTLDEGIARGQPLAAPSFSLPVLQHGDLGPALSPEMGPALADRRVRLEELRGRPVVLNFWASWCDPCREEASALERGWRRHRRQGVFFLGTNVQDLPGDARGFLRELRVTYPSVREPANEVARRYGVSGLPETFFLSRKGEVVGHVVGALSERELEDGVAAARSGRPARVDRSGAGASRELR